MFFEKPRDLVTDTAAPGDPTFFAERVHSAYRDTVANANTFSREMLAERAYDERIKAIKDAIGEDLQNPYRTQGLVERSLADAGYITSARDVFDKRLKTLAEKHPDKAGVIGADRPVLHDATRAARGVADAHEDTARRYSGGGFTGGVADFIGGMAAQTQDPINAASLLIGPMGRAKAGARGVLEMGVKQGLANAGVESAMQPVIQNWRKDVGLEYGISQAATNVVIAGGFGFGADAGVRGAFRGYKSARGQVPVLDSSGGVAGYESKADAMVRAESAAARKAVQALPPEVIQKAEAGDLDAAEQVLTATGGIKDPSVRGALNAARMQDEIVPIEGIDDGSRVRNLTQTMRALSDADEPLPAGVDVSPKSKTPDLADDVALPKGVDGNQHYRNLEIDGKPVAYRSLDAAALTTDAETFQFKSQGDGAGVTGSLRGVQTWDPMASGRVVVFERRDGTLVIADGHQRLGLARQVADQNPEMTGFVFREADGWTPDDVRALAAKKNLQEGSGSLIDAAKVFRDRPDIMDDSLPGSTEFMRQARALSRLSDTGFAHVVGGLIEPKHGALVADLVRDKARHADVIEMLAKLNPETDRAARLAIGEIIRSPVTVDEQLTLLGVEIAPRSLLEERVAVLDGALKTLRRDRRVFQALTDNASRIEDAGNRLETDANRTEAIQAETTAAVIERLAPQRGFVSTALNQSAKAISEGHPVQRAVDAFLRRVEERMADGGVKGLDGDRVTLTDASRDGVMFSTPPSSPIMAKSVEDFASHLQSVLKEAEQEPAPARIDDVRKQAAQQIADMKDRAEFETVKAASMQPSPRLELDPSQPFRITEAANARMIEIHSEIDRTMQMLPPDVRIRVEDRLVFDVDGRDVSVDGMWNGYERLVYVALASGDPVRTVRHEVIHALRQSGLMSHDEFKTMYAFAEKLKLREAYEIDKQYKANYAQMYGHRGDDYVEMLLREETIANMFSDYSLNGRRYGDVAGGGLIDSIIDNIVAFMTLVRDRLSALGFKHVRDIFEDIESGRMAQREPDQSIMESMTDVIAPMMSNKKGIDVKRDDLGSIAEVVRNGMRFAIERDPTGAVNALRPLADEHRETLIAGLRQIAGDAIDERIITGAVDTLLPLIRQGDQAGINSRVQGLARSMQPAPIRTPETMIEIAMADVQRTADEAVLVSACKI